MAPKLDLESRVTIRKLTERGVTATEIAEKLGVTEGAVRYHVRRQAQRAEDGRTQRAQSKAASHHDAIAEWLAQCESWGSGVNLSDLHRWLAVERAFAGSLRSVERYVAKHFPRPRKRARRRIETPPGAQAQLDWAEHRGVHLGGRVVILYSFHLRLSFSRYEVVVWSERKDLLAWLHCHNEALGRLDGVPATMRIDNEKTAVIHGAGPWGEVHPAYLRYAQVARFHVDACLPRHPQHKGKVERGIRDFRRLVRVHDRAWSSLAELQEVTDLALIDSARRRTCRATGDSVESAFAQELPCLGTLAPLPSPFDLVATRKVSMDCMVRFEGREYSVPFSSAGATVEVRGCAESVEIIRDAQVIARHPRHGRRPAEIDASHFEGPATDTVLAPTPLGRMGRRLAEIAAIEPERRPLDLYAALAEAAR